MAHASTSLTRTAYTAIASGGDTVNVQLPIHPYRTQTADAVELITATSTPTVPSDIASPHRDATVLVNQRDQFVAVTQLTVDSADTLYARWLGQHTYPDESGADSDLYVVTF